MICCKLNSFRLAVNWTTVHQTTELWTCLFSDFRTDCSLFSSRNCRTDRDLLRYRETGVHDVTVQTISAQCKVYMTFILGDVTVRILGRFSIKLEKAVPLRYKHKKMYILMLFLIISKHNYTFLMRYLWMLKHLFPYFW